MRFVSAILVAGLSLTTGAVLAQDNEAEDQSVAPQTTRKQQDSAEQSEPDPLDEIICRRRRVTGSLTRRVETCRTRREWNEVADRTRDAMDATVRGAAGGKVCTADVMGGC